MDIEKILFDIVCAIVDSPDQVSITRTDSDDEVRFVLTVAPEEMGMVIGRHGKIAKAIRTLVKAAATGSGKKVTVDIR